MRRLMAAAAAIALMAATDAAAEDWQPADMGGGMVVGVEVSSIRASGRLRTAMVIFAFARTRSDGADFMVAATGFDCVAHTVAVIGTSHYAADGALLSTDGDGADAPDDPIRPGSLFQSVEDMVCRGRRYPADFSDGVEFAAAARQLLLQDGVR